VPIFVFQGGLPSASEQGRASIANGSGESVGR
jgi:hypothetical protein